MFPVSVARMRSMEQAAIAAGVPEYELMCRAGNAAADLTAFHYPAPGRIVILCGGGNNGGDALVCARRLHEHYRREVVVFSVRDRESFSGCAGNAASDLPDDIPFYLRDSLENVHFYPGDVIVDGLLGIGYSGGKMRENIAAYIRKVNAASLPVVALDLPSGLNGDTGVVSDVGAVNAALTITFGAPKTGLFLNDGARYRGVLRLVDIGSDKGADTGEFECFTNIDAQLIVPRCECDCHKNSRGRVLVWGSSEKYPGAAALTSEAALRCGSGIVRLISCGRCDRNLPNAVIYHHIPNGCDPGREVEQFFPCSDVLIAGCGWGDETPPEALKAVWNFPGVVVLDADALNLISRNPGVWQARENVIMTPHPGEAARLAHAAGIGEVSCRRVLALLLAEKYHACIVLKGKDTLVASPEGRIIVSSSGNFKLATAGSGDVLAGCIGAFAGNGLPLMDSAALGAYLHGVAGENSCGMIADDLPLLAGKILSSIRESRIF